MERHLVVVERTANGGSPLLRAQHPDEPWEWGTSVHLGDARVRLRDLAAAVHAHAPNVVVRDAGQIDCHWPRLQINVGRGRGARCWGG